MCFISVILVYFTSIARRSRFEKRIFRKAKGWKSTLKARGRRVERLAARARGGISGRLYKKNSRKGAPARPAVGQQKGQATPNARAVVCPLFHDRSPFRALRGAAHHRSASRVTSRYGT